MSVCMYVSVCLCLCIDSYHPEEVGRRYDDIQISHDKYRLHDDIIYIPHVTNSKYLRNTSMRYVNCKQHGMSWLAQFHNLHVGTPAALSKSFCEL